MIRKGKHNVWFLALVLENKVLLDNYFVAGLLIFCLCICKPHSSKPLALGDHRDKTSFGHAGAHALHVQLDDPLCRPVVQPVLRRLPHIRVRSRLAQSALVTAVVLCHERLIQHIRVLGRVDVVHHALRNHRQPPRRLLCN